MGKDVYKPYRRFGGLEMEHTWKSKEERMDKEVRKCNVECILLKFRRCIT